MMTMLKIRNQIDHVLSGLQAAIRMGRGQRLFHRIMLHRKMVGGMTATAILFHRSHVVLIEAVHPQSTSQNGTQEGSFNQQGNKYERFHVPSSALR